MVLAPLRRFALGATLFAAGCGVAPGGEPVAPQLPPRAEALAYFPADAPAVALVATDLGPLRRLGAALPEGARERLRAAAHARGLLTAQLRPLLGNELAVGIPRPGDAPLAAIVTRDPVFLDALAGSRVTAARAARAGRYRGADLYAGRGHAFAVRGPVLLVGRTTGVLRAALDRRGGDGTLDEDALPRKRGKPVLRASIDLRPLVARAGPRARAVPWLAALQRLALTLRLEPGAAVADLEIDTSGAELVERDVPIAPGARAPRAVRGGAPSLAVRDLAHVLGFAEAAARTAFPLGSIRLELARATLRRAARVDVSTDVIARMHGPATLVLGRRGVALRAEPSRPRALRRALNRVARGLPRALARARVDRVRMRRDRDLHVVEPFGAFGVVDGAFVAGTAPARELRALARAPLGRPRGARGAVVVSAPGDVVAEWLAAYLGVDAAPAWALSGWLRGGTEKVVGRLELQAGGATP